MHAPLSTRSIVQFLGLKRGVLALLGMVVLVGMGEKMAERFLPVYLLSLGGGALAVGLLNGLDNLLSALYSFPGGYLSDRLGATRRPWRSSTWWLWPASCWSSSSHTGSR
jgi:MFS family permease